MHVLSFAVQTLFKQIRGLAQVPKLPNTESKQVSPKGRLLPLHRELEPLINVQVYGLQQVPGISYWVFKHSSPAFLSQTSAVVAVTAVADDVADALVDWAPVAVETAVVARAAEVVGAAVVADGSVQSPPMQFRPVAHLPSLFPHGLFRAICAVYWQYQSTGVVKIVPSGR